MHKRICKRLIKAQDNNIQCIDIGIYELQWKDFNVKYNSRECKGKDA